MGAPSHPSQWKPAESTGCQRLEGFVKARACQTWDTLTQLYYSTSWENDWGRRIHENFEYEGARPGIERLHLKICQCLWCGRPPDYFPWCWNLFWARLFSPPSNPAESTQMLIASFWSLKTEDWCCLPLFLDLIFGVIIKAVMPKQVLSYFFCSLHFATCTRQIQAVSWTLGLKIHDKSALV